MLQLTPTNENHHPRFATPESLADVRHLNQKQLAQRWCLSHRTLERWRCLGQGPVWLKVGGRVLYRIEDVQNHERSKVVEAPRS